MAKVILMMAAFAVGVSNDARLFASLFFGATNASVVALSRKDDCFVKSDHAHGRRQHGKEIPGNVDIKTLAADVYMSKTGEHPY